MRHSRVRLAPDLGDQGTRKCGIRKPRHSRVPHLDDDLGDLVSDQEGAMQALNPETPTMKPETRNLKPGTRNPEPDPQSCRGRKMARRVRRRWRTMTTLRSGRRRDRLIGRGWRRTGDRFRPWVTWSVRHGRPGGADISVWQKRLG
jgi:hypothetical protein